MNIACCVAIFFDVIKGILIEVMEMSKVLLRTSIERVLVDALALATITVSEATFHPTAAMLLKSG